MSPSLCGEVVRYRYAGETWCVAYTTRTLLFSVSCGRDNLEIRGRGEDCAKATHLLPVVPQRWMQRPVQREPVVREQPSEVP